MSLEDPEITARVKTEEGHLIDHITTRLDDGADPQALARAINRVKFMVDDGELVMGMVQ